MLTKSNKKMKFVVVILMPCGVIYACYFGHGYELGADATESRIVMNIQHAHELLQDCNVEITHKIVKHQHGWMSPCERCEIHKISKII